MTPGGEGQDPVLVHRVLTLARERGVAPLLCEVLADGAAPAEARDRVLDELLALLPEARDSVSRSAPWTTGRSSAEQPKPRPA